MGLKLELVTGETIAVPDAIAAQGPAAIDAFHQEADVVLGLGAAYDENQRRAVRYAELRLTLSEDEARAALDPLPPTDPTAPGAHEE
jgi:hypothetical protein